MEICDSNNTCCKTKSLPIISKSPWSSGLMLGNCSKVKQVKASCTRVIQLMLNHEEPWTVRLNSSVLDSVWNSSWIQILTSDPSLTFQCSREADTQEFNCLSSTCQLFKDTNIKGNNVPSKEVVLSQHECATLCFGTKNCLFWQWSQKATECWLKSKGAFNFTISGHVDYILGSRACGAPLGNSQFFLYVLFFSL